MAGLPKTVSLASPWGLAVFAAVGVLFLVAYRFRLHSINEIGPIIHDFDAQFNYRATEYLYKHGWHQFFTWFDDSSWYPLGRPVGSTIYPGLQITGVFLKTALLKSWSIVEVCCYIPAWFGGVGSMLVGVIAYQAVVSQDKPTAPGYSLVAIVTGILAMAMMAIIPAHLLRCVGGKFDNESVAISAMLGTFCCWVRSLRNDSSMTSNVIYSTLAGGCYFFMAATWGGHIFALNLIGIHAAVSVLLGRFTHKLYTSYSCFYFVGTVLAMQIPVIGWTPVTSLEQLGPFLVFLGYQVLRLCQFRLDRQKEKLSKVQRWEFYFKVCCLSFLLLGLVLAALYFQGILETYVIPVQARVRMLLTSKSSSGNPLVDGVAEHGATQDDAYLLYLGIVGMIAPLGLIQLLVYHWKNNDTTTFMLCWGLITYVFSQKMSRLVVLLSPVACVLAAQVVGRLLVWSFKELLRPDPDDEDNGEGANKGVSSTDTSGSSNAEKESTNKAFAKLCYSKEGEAIKHFLSLMIPIVFLILSEKFFSESYAQVPALSESKIVFKARLHGNEVVVKDYIKSSEWLRENTPSDARIMAWWPHGYRLAAIANRTTLSDGNTWSHDHLALLGLIFTTDVEKGYGIVRHLADYVVVSAGGTPDDIGRGNYMAQVAHSVYRDHCPGDPACRYYSFMDKKRTPSPMMKRSMLYQLHAHNIRSDVQVDPAMFEEVYRSTYDKVRIFRVVGVSSESKEWISDPTNKICDVGKNSWICRGQYPPALKPVLSTRADYKDEEYKKDYMDSLENPRRPKYTPGDLKEEETAKPILTSFTPPPSKDIELVYNNWDDSEQASLMSNVISSANLQQFKSLLSEDSKLAFVRSNDGRGTMFWAFEYENEEMIRILSSLGVPHTDKDANGLAPQDVNPGLYTKIFHPKEHETSVKQMLYTRWNDSEQTALMWNMISSGNVKQVRSLLNQDSKLAFVRSNDGRGPMWWAYQFGNAEIIKMLDELGVPHAGKDANGVTPVDLNPDLYAKVVNPRDHEKDVKNQLYNRWQDSEQTSLMWNMISTNNVPQVQSLLTQDSKLAFVRSKDGRGAMWWAFEAGNVEIIKLLKDLKVPTGDKDSQGIVPEQLYQGNDREGFLAKVRTI